MVENLKHSKTGEKYMDYNSMVDEILEICPHYNYTSEHKTSRSNKKQKKNPENTEEEKSLLGRSLAPSNRSPLASLKNSRESVTGTFINFSSESFIS